MNAVTLVWRKLFPVLLAAMLLAAGWGIYLWFAGGPAADPVAAFLARHWAQPIAPQGDPPAGFSAIEASLAPQTCGACHVMQYADWNSSLHSRTMGPGIRWQLRVMNQAEANDCLRCHAPLAEQKALVALEHGWTNAPQQPLPVYVSPDLHRRGNTCASCHVRRHQRFGPPAASRSPKLHGGFVAEAAFRDSRFCSPCHQFPPGARSLAGKLIENTYEEWRSSPAARAGQTCQTCHMPDRRHIWRGIHDQETVRKALRREVEIRRLEGSRVRVVATLSAPGVGHYFPTYVVPKVLASLHLRTSAGSREIGRVIIGRTVSVDMDREWSDTRIPPGGRSLLSVELEAPQGPYKIELQVEIAPAEHYARMYRAMLERNPGMEAVAQGLLRQALREAEATTYRLEEIVAVGPERAGQSVQAIAN